MKNDPFHQTLALKISFNRTYQSGELNRILKKLGATLYYDVYAFDRNDKAPNWQSESYADITTFFEEQEVDAQENSDSLEISYPLATIGTEYIPVFAELVEKIATVFHSSPELNGNRITIPMLIEHCDTLSTDLLQTWGEEPGSKNLRILIETS